jgi:hypothetical protein
MKNTCSLLIVGLFLIGAPASADEMLPWIGQNGYVSLETDSLVALDLHMPLGKDSNFFGLIPELNAQFGFGGGAVGINWALSAVIPDEGDSGMWLGNIDIYAKGRYCLEMGVQLCFGGQLDVGIAPYDYADSIDADAAAATIGNMSMLRSNRFGAKMLTVSPSLVATLKAWIAFAQISLGLDVWIPYADTDSRDSEQFLIFEVAGGVILFDALAVGAGFRVLDMLSQDNTDAAGALDLFVKYNAGVVEPTLMFSIPLDDSTREIYTFGISAGIAARF